MTGLDEEGIKDQILVYSNPANREINIHTKSFQSNNVSITDARGIIVYLDSIPFTESKLFSFPKLFEGFYFIILFGKSVSKSMNLLKK